MVMNEKLVTHLKRVKAIKFGDFTLKSGMKSNYFINIAETLKEIDVFNYLCQCYAQKIEELISQKAIDQPTILFGPAYKGIPLVAGISANLNNKSAKDIGICFNRKEEKDHGEGGMFMGKMPTREDKVLLIDDVLTMGTALTQTIKMLEGINIVGLLVAVDREEKVEGKLVAESLMEKTGFQIFSLLKMQNIIP